MNRINGAVLVLALGSMSLPVAASNLIANGGFEENAVSGSFDTYFASSQGLVDWIIGVNSVDLIGSYWQPAEGSRSLDLNGLKKGEIHQTISTVAGQQYQLAFEMAGNVDGGPLLKQLSVNLGGPGIYTFDISNPGGLDHSNMGWTSHLVNFLATDNSTVVSFASNVSGPYGPALDNVSVTAVPEPESYAMLLAGLGLVGAMTRRRSGKTS